MEGQCQCGQIQFTTPTPKPSAIYICHCTECRHQSSSAFGMTAIFPTFEIKSPHPGAISMYSRPNPTGMTEGYFCTKCGSRLMHKHIPDTGSISIKSGCLDGMTKEMMRTAIHIWTKSAVMDIPEGVESYEEEPPEAVSKLNERDIGFPFLVLLINLEYVFDYDPTDLKYCR